MTVQRGSLLQLLRQCCHLHAVQGHSPAASSNTSHLLASALVWLRQDGSNSSGSRWLPFGGASKGEKIPKPERKDVQPTPSVCRVDAAGMALCRQRSLLRKPTSLLQSGLNREASGLR